MKIEVKGNSGCNIAINEENDVLYVYKTSNDKNYHERLLRQGHKQEQALTTNTILTPPVYYIGNDENDDALLKMKYIYGKNFIDFFETCTPQELDSFCNNIISYIVDEINECKTETVSCDIMLKKLASIREACKKNKYANNTVVESILDAAEKIFTEAGDMVLPVGTCHGDMTFSNIIFGSSNYYLIDFLDSFIETPLQDIVKLRQDSHYMWSLNMYESKCYDKIRIRMIFDYIDEMIDSYFEKFPFYSKYYNLMQLMNILRILPYTKSREVYDFLIKTLYELIMVRKLVNISKSNEKE